MVEATEATTDLEQKVQEFKCAGAVVEQALKHQEFCKAQLDAARNDVEKAFKELSDARSRLLYAADPIAAERQYW